MKAISIKGYWAGLILVGEKTIETRSWQTHYRGDLLICVTKKPVYPLSGMALCVVELVDCHPMTLEDEAFAKVKRWKPGLYSWVLRNVRSIDIFPVTGQLGLFNVDDKLIRMV